MAMVFGCWCSRVWLVILDMENVLRHRPEPGYYSGNSHVGWSAETEK